MAKAPKHIATRSTPKQWSGTVPSAATAVVKRIEGFYSHPYDDNGSLPGGTWTIGYGTIVDAKGNPVSPQTTPVTEAEAAIFIGMDPTNACVRAWREIDSLDDWPAF